MGFGKDIFCHGIEPYNFRDTRDTVATITANVGQSTAIGPKVAIRRNKPFDGGDLVVERTNSDGEAPEVMGTLDANVYQKNTFQDNSKYIIEKRKKEKMKFDNENIRMFRKAMDVSGVEPSAFLASVKKILSIVKDGIMDIGEAITAIDDLAESVESKGGSKDGMSDMVKEDEKLVEAQTAKGNNEDSGIAEDEVCIVRRLCPTETSRLQGFPDDYTKIDGPNTSDAPQFKSHGNSWATPCANFMLTRIEMELRRLGHKGTINYATCCSGIEAHSVAVRNLDWKAIFFSEIEPFPCRVLAHHYPEVPNLGDMTQIHFDAEKGCITNSHKEGEEYFLPSEFKKAEIREIPYKEGDMQVFSGGTPCFAAGTLVLTETGYRPIEEIKIGDRVVTHEGRLRKVVAVGNKKSDNIVAVKCASRNEAIVCTADHKFWSAVNPHQDFRRKSDTYLQILFDGCEFKEISKVGEHGFVAQLAKYEDIPIPEIPKVYEATEQDVVELAGWYLGDGYIRGFSNKSKECVIFAISESKKKAFEKRFGGVINASIGNPDKNGLYKIQVACTALAKWLRENFGELSHRKTIPAWLICGSEETKKHFIAGYLATDGYKLKNVDFGASTVSKSLAYGLADLLGKSCICEAKVPEKKTMYDGRVVNQRHFYTVRRHTKPNRFHEYGKWNFVRVREILPTADTTVYNITVEEDHSYVVQGLCVKNCQSISIAGKREGMAEDSGTRSSLAFHYQRIIDESKPMFTLWENVSGAFSSNGGADFIWFVNKCAESGYAMAWRVLDAQYVMTEEFPRAVPQRRNRIWLVGYRGNDWRIPARIVFELTKDVGGRPTRVSGIGFKELSEDCEATPAAQSEKESATKPSGDLFAAVKGESDDSAKLLKVSKLIDFSEMPDEADFSKVSVDKIYEFCSKVGIPGYIGNVFRTDKKCKKQKVVETGLFDFFADEAKLTVAENAESEATTEAESDEWVGAEKITPAILENIGDAGILANGRIATMVCPKWTGGIALSPTSYAAWVELVKNREWLKANDLLPKAYDGTVCGLGDVLLEVVDEKYNLSWRACYGILKRAETRGKELPRALEIALIATIREYAGIVKWYALNGRDTVKKEGDTSERDSARMCFERFVSPVKKFEDVVPEEPKKNGGESDSTDDDDEEISDEELAEMEEEFTDNGEEAEEKPPKPSKKSGRAKCGLSKKDFPNGVINTSGGETAATLIASGDAAVGTTQDANVIAHLERSQPKSE